MGRDSIHIIDRGVAIVAASNRAKSQECVCGAQLNEQFESPQHREGPSISVRARLTGRVFFAASEGKRFVSAQRDLFYWFQKKSD